jgi:hypothetical protein
MAVDMFFKVDGIEGESQDEKHAKEIECLPGAGGCRNQARCTRAAVAAAARSRCKT